MAQEQPSARRELREHSGLPRPFYPVPLVDYAVRPSEVVKIAGQPLIRTAGGQWLLVDQADVGVRETDD